jgi:hypothetical protein
MVTTDIKIDIMIPIIGAKKINKIVLIIVSLSTILAQEKSIPLTMSACAIAAPAKPPISVWEEEEGIPYHQVSKFQKIAANKPENITGKVIKSLYTVLLMELATAWSLKIQKATELNKAAHNTAWKGVNTLVETTVAIELAAS